MLSIGIQYFISTSPYLAIMSNTFIINGINVHRTCSHSHDSTLIKQLFKPIILPATFAIEDALTGDTNAVFNIIRD
jgi:hypothetical protein